MFAYCNNCPVSLFDSQGKSPAAAAGCVLMGTISNVCSYVVGCLLSNQEIELGGILSAAYVGAVNGFAGAVAGALSLTGKLITSVITGSLSAMTTEGSLGVKVTAFAFSSVSTFVGANVDTSASNELGEFVVSFAATGYISCPADMLSVCTQKIITDSAKKKSNHRKPSYKISPEMAVML